MGIGTPLVMGVNTAVGAEVMLGGFGIEFIAFQHIFTLEDLDPASGTEPTIAPLRRQIEQSQRRGFSNAIRRR